LKVYPNPVTGLLSIEADKMIYDIMFINSQGKIMLQPVPGNSHYQLNLDGFEAGQYILLLKFENEILLKKVLVN
jgi:hypothetical protein